jgi:hypothetical protein
VAVGGDLQVSAMWSEGPLWVGGDLTAAQVLACSDNDHGAEIVGVLTTPVLAHLDDHSLVAGTRAVVDTFIDLEVIPSVARVALRR